MKRHQYFIISVAITLCYWCIESFIHYYFFHEPVLEFVPDDVNELWMRISISMLILAFGLFADHHTRKLREKEQDKLRVFKATVAASNHILNNYLQQMFLFKLEALNCDDFSSEVLELFDHTMDQTTAEIRKLNSLTEIDEKNIHKAVYPQ